MPPTMLPPVHLQAVARVDGVPYLLPVGKILAMEYGYSRREFEAGVDEIEVLPNAANGRIGVEPGDDGFWILWPTMMHLTSLMKDRPFDSASMPRSKAFVTPQVALGARSSPTDQTANIRGMSESCLSSCLSH